MVYFGYPGQSRGNQPVGEFVLAREGNLDILASWHQLGCLAAGLAPCCFAALLLLCCAALLLCHDVFALLLIRGSKISIFWCLWHHENIGFV